MEVSNSPAQPDFFIGEEHLFKYKTSHDILYME